MPGTTKQDHQAERLQAIRLRYSINTHFTDRGITTQAVIVDATCPPTWAAFWPAGNPAGNSKQSGTLSGIVALVAFSD